MRLAIDEQKKLLEELAHEHFEIAKATFEMFTDERLQHPPVMVIVSEDKQKEMIINLSDLMNEDSKDLIPKLMESALEVPGTGAVLFITEAWQVRLKEGEEPIVPLSLDPRRQEVIKVLLFARDICTVILHEIQRKPNRLIEGKICWHDGGKLSGRLVPRNLL